MSRFISPSVRRLLSAAVAAPILAAGLPAAARAQAAPKPAPAPARPPAAAAKPAAATTTVAFACPERGAFGPGPRYFSQFYEDYILSYVFRRTPKGIFVDVGANDADASSVTKAFYLKGWRGVNIEPNPELLTKIKERRPEDVNLGVGISDAAATLTFFMFDAAASGISTFDPGIAQRHRRNGYVYRELEVPVVTLTEALDKSGLVKGGFEFLNVDVEGFERKVLAGLDVAKYPPKVIVLEATQPLTEQPTEQHWEDLLFNRGYGFAFDDGLNRYYVRRTERDLQVRFLEVAYCVAKDKLSKGIKLDGFMLEPGR